MWLASARMAWPGYLEASRVGQRCPVFPSIPAAQRRQHPQRIRARGDGAPLRWHSSSRQRHCPARCAQRARAGVSSRRRWCWSSILRSWPSAYRWLSRGPLDLDNGVPASATANRINAPIAFCASNALSGEGERQARRRGAVCRDRDIMASEVLALFEDFSTCLLWCADLGGAPSSLRRCGNSSDGRASASQAECRGFDSRFPLIAEMKSRLIRRCC